MVAHQKLSQPLVLLIFLRSLAKFLPGHNTKPSALLSWSNRRVVMSWLASQRHKQFWATCSSAIIQFSNGARHGIRAQQNCTWGQGKRGGEPPPPLSMGGLFAGPATAGELYLSWWVTRSPGLVYHVQYHLFCIPLSYLPLCRLSFENPKKEDLRSILEVHISFSLLNP